MSTETTINQMKFNQLSETKYNQIVPEEGQFYITPDYTDLPILTHHWFDHIVNDMQWLRADTFSWQSGDVYTTAYNHLINDINNAPIQADTINGITINYWLASDGHKIVGTAGGDVYEQNIIDLYNQTGVAWYYLLDTTNHRFKLPRTKFGFTGLRDNVGNYVAPGLPNIETVFVNHWRDYSNGRSITPVSGALNIESDTYPKSSYPNVGPASSGSYYYDQTLKFDASRSSSIYGNSDTVQSPATQMYLYFYAGNFTKTAIEQTAGITSETLNDKADIDLVNDKADIELVKLYSMIPSDNYIDISSIVPIDNTAHSYTAPDNGYLFVTKRCTASQYVGAYDDTLYTHYEVWANSGQMANLFLPVRKGQTVIIRGNANGADFIARFIYAYRY